MEICRAKKSDIGKLIDLRLEYLNCDYGKLKSEQEKEIVSQGGRTGIPKTWL